MAHTRTAIDTIRGYYYQFDLYALELLESNDEEITLEGIEDVDIKNATETTAIQCKYYEGTTYNHSVIAEPIRLMLNHFSKNKSRDFRYKLYGFYSGGQDKLKFPLTIDFVKSKFFTFKKQGIKHEYHHELGLNDEDISLFISRLSIDVFAKSFMAQNDKLIEKIKQNWSCNQVEAENLYYPIVLKIVREIATDKKEAKRRINKSIFMAKVNEHRNPLVDIWFAEKCDADDYHKRMHRMYFTHGVNISPCERFFLIDCDATITDVEIKQMITSICHKWSKISRREQNPFVPYIYMNGLPLERITRIKEMLFSDGMQINDGHPYHLSPFKPNVIVQTPKGQDKSVKIIDSLNAINDVLGAIHYKTREIYQFYLDKPFWGTNEHKLVSLYIKTTKEVEQII